MATHSNGGGAAMDNYDIERDYGPANWDIPHRFVASYLYDIPFLKNSPSTVLRSLVGGWQVSGITTWQSGTPVNITLSAGIGPTSGSPGGQRPNLVGSVPELNCQPNTPGATQDVQRRLINCYDASAFAHPAAVHIRQRRDATSCADRSRSPPTCR